MHNLGRIDRIIRVFVGMLVLALWFVLPAGAQWLSLLGLIPLATGFLGSCPAYKLFGIDTTRLDTKKGSCCSQ